MGNPKALQDQSCPTCGNPINCCTDLTGGGQTLDPGDYALCEKCGALLQMGSAGLVTAVSDDVLRQDQRFDPRSIDQLFEVQRAIRARARLLVSEGPDGRTVTMISQIEGRKKDYGVS